MHVQASAQQRGCRLLQLPRELRDEIYVLALGGRIIHTDDWSAYKPDAIKVCAVPTAQNEAHLPSMFPPKSSPEDFFSFRHRNCVKCPGDELALALLVTCRQVHAEAQYLPFSENIFASRRPGSLFGFLKRIGDARAAGIRELLLYSANNFRPWSCQASTFASLPLQDLRTVRLYLELCGRDFTSYGTITSKPIDFANVDNSGGIFAGLRGLQAFKVTRITMVLDCGRPDGASLLLPPRPILEDWIEQIKKMIKGQLNDGNQRIVDRQVANDEVSVDV